MNMLFKSDVPAQLPDHWRDAANWHLRSADSARAAELRRILVDRRMLPFWQAADASGSGDRWHRRLLAILVVGGDPPAENRGEIKERRRHLAERVRSLVELIDSDPDAKGVDVEELLHWTCPSADQREWAPDATSYPPAAHIDSELLDWEDIPPSSHGAKRAPLLSRLFAEAGGKMIMRAALVTSEARRVGMAPSVSSLLGALAARLDSDSPLSSLDPLERVPWAATRGLSRASRLVRALNAEAGDRLGFGSIALAATVVTGENITSSKARAIWKEFQREKPDK